MINEIPIELNGRVGTQKQRVSKTMCDIVIDRLETSDLPPGSSTSRA